jgi:quercetin dioxygenase-like cupin family protein
MTGRAVLIALAAASLAGAAQAEGDRIAAPGDSAALTATSSGQPIVAPSGPLQVTASIVEIGAGRSTPEHRHPFPRLGYVLSGRLEVVNLETGRSKVLETGQFTADPIGQWHLGRALGGKPVRLLVIDETPPGQSNSIPRTGR